MDHARFLAHEDFLIRNLAAESLGALPTVRSLSLLFNHLEDPLIRKSVVLAVTAILRARPQHFRSVMLRCLNEKRDDAHAALLDVLANYVDYLAGEAALPRVADRRADPHGDHPPRARPADHQLPQPQRATRQIEAQRGPHPEEPCCGKTGASPRS